MRLPPGETGYVDDAAPSAFAHVRHGVTDGTRGGIEFLLEEAGELAVGHLEEILRDDGCRRIHQNVEAAEFLDHARVHGADRSIICDVGDDAERAVRKKRTDFADGCGVDGGILADEDDARAFGNELPGARFADAAAAAGNNGNPVFEPEIQTILLAKLVHRRRSHLPRAGQPPQASCGGGMAGHDGQC
ncbi:MAG: hypothetical protein WCA56_12290 [Xanthobacteraceae bacterium]